MYVRKMDAAAGYKSLAVNIYGAYFRLFFDSDLSLGMVQKGMRRAIRKPLSTFLVLPISLILLVLRDTWHLQAFGSVRLMFAVGAYARAHPGLHPSIRQCVSVRQAVASHHKRCAVLPCE